MRPAIPGPTDNSAFNLLRLHLAAPMSDRDYVRDRLLANHEILGPDSFGGEDFPDPRPEVMRTYDPVQELTTLRGALVAGLRALDRLEGKDRRTMAESLGEQRDREAHERLQAAREERRKHDRRVSADRRVPVAGTVRADPVGRAIEALRCAERSLESGFDEAGVDYVRQALLALGAG